MWYKTFLTLVALVLTVTFSSAAFAKEQTYANDTYEFKGKEVVRVTADVSSVPLWTTVPYRKGGPYLATACRLLLKEYSVALKGITMPECVGTIAAVSGIKNPDVIAADTMVMVPSPTNTSAGIIAQRKEREEIMQLANNPLGMVVKLREVASSLAAFNERLTTLEENQIDRAAVQELVNEALRSSDAVKNMTAFARDEVNKLVAEQLANLPDQLTQEQFSQLLEQAMAQAGVPQAIIDAATKAVGAEMKAITDRLDGVEADVETLQSDVEILQDDVEALQNAERTSNWLPAILVAFVASLVSYGLSALYTRGHVKDQASATREALKTSLTNQAKVLTGTIEGVEAKANMALAAVKVATNLHFKDGALLGDLPSQKEVEDLNLGESISIRIRKDDGQVVTVVFTRRADILSDGKGGKLDGLEVAGIARLKQGCALRVTSMLRVLKNAEANHTLVGVEKTELSAAA